MTKLFFFLLFFIIFNVNVFADFAQKDTPQNLRRHYTKLLPEKSIPKTSLITNEEQLLFQNEGKQKVAVPLFIKDDSKDFNRENTNILPNVPIKIESEKILVPIVLNKIAEYLGGLDVNYLMQTCKSIKKSFDSFQSLKLVFFQKNIQNTFLKWLADPIQMFNRVPLSSLKVAYGEDKTKILQGCLLIYGEKYSEAWEVFQGKKLPTSIQEKINWAASNVELDFTENTSRAYLEQQAQDGDQDAQKSLNIAAYRTSLDFRYDTGKGYLEQRAQNGDQHAQECLNNAAYNNLLDFRYDTGKGYLEQRAQNGDQHAQECLNNAAYNNLLDFRYDTGKEYLEQRIQNGDQHAQDLLNQAHFTDRLNFSNESDESCRIYLNEQVLNGNQEAQHYLNNAAYNKRLGFTDQTGKEYLEQRVQNGDQDAQQFLDSAAINGELGFTNETGKEYIEQCAQNGNQHAQNILNYAPYYKDLTHIKTKESSFRWFFKFYNLAVGFDK